MEEYQEPNWRVAWRQQAENKWMVYGSAFYQFWDYYLFENSDNPTVRF